MNSRDNNSLKIREAKTTDVSLLLTWGKKLYEFEKQYLPLLKYSEKEAKERYESQIENPSFYFLVAEYNNKPVGYLYAHLDKVDYLETEKPECEIEVIFLEETARGKGIAIKLINQCIIWAKQNNAFNVKAGIFAENTASRAVFEKAGFQMNHITYTKNLNK